MPASARPLASSLDGLGNGTAGPKRLLPPHKGAPGRKSSPNGAALQALANIATSRRTGAGKRASNKTAHLGKHFPARTGVNDANSQHPVDPAKH